LQCHTIVAEVNVALSGLSEWVRPVSVPTPSVLLPASSYVQPEPVGTVLIISPWNFPIQLCLNPAVAAIAAGNAVVMKPSEVSPHSAALLQELVERYLDREGAIQVVQGAVAETTELLRQRVDHILYTGNDKIARVVMRAAAEHLTPVTLELGGKSPTIVDSTANLDLAAERIIAGKCLNAGQVCIAPDYVLADQSIVDPLVAKMKKAITKFYGEDPAGSNDFARIVNRQHFGRIKRLLDSAGGKIEAGGQTNESDLYVAPTLIRDPAKGSDILREEIFGPLLPVLAVAGLDDAIRTVNAGEKPLALYLFTSSSRSTAKVLGSTSAGGTVINDCILHNANPYLPFGGVGNSGMGAYHGKWGFDTFSHRRAVLHQSTLIDNGPVRYPPFSSGQLRLINTLVKVLPDLPRVGIKDVLLVGLSVAVAVLAAKVAGKF
jgi:aldehyde dehydrogenase (NAD+)